MKAAPDYRIIGGGSTVQSVPLQAWLLAPNQDATARVLSLLHDEEQSHRARFANARDRDVFAVTRAALRCLLSLELGVPPAEVKLVSGPWGKPLLAEAHRRPHLDFSVAHSGDHSVIAISRRGRTGIDIERSRPVPEHGKIAAEVFGGETALNLGRVPADRRDDIFLRLWTAGEACLKAEGLGFAGNGGRAPVELSSDGAPQIKIDPNSPGASHSGWALLSLDLPPGYVGNVAIENSAHARHAHCVPEHVDIAHLTTCVS
ncbi:MAG: 4'-phosphopantetheinyl transferase family protein [Xanthobacteraceae bacterium]